MKLITLNGESLYLCHHPVDWSTSPQVEFYLPVQVERGLSGREARAPMGESIRVSRYSYATLLEGAPLRELRAALEAHTTERVLVPLWPFAQPAADYPSSPITGGYNISYEPGFTTFEIHTGRAPSPAYTLTAKTVTAPLLMGYFATAPEPQPETDELVEWRFQFLEDSPVEYALQVDAQSFAPGPDLGAGAIPLFPQQPDFAKAAKTGGVEIDRGHGIVGQGRQGYMEHYGADPERMLQFGYTLDGVSEIARLLRFFQDRRAISESFWLPDYLAPTRLAAPVADGETILTVTDGSALAGYEFYCLRDASRVIPFEIDTVAGDQITLTSAPGAFGASRNSISKLILARFTKRRLQLTFETGAHAHLSTEFRELVPERAVAPEETLGSTLGALAARASLYTFQSKGQVWRYTSYERDLTFRGEVYTAAGITHGRVTRTLTLQDKTTLQAELNTVEPLLQKWRKQLGLLTVMVRLVEVSGADASGGRVVFNGECYGVERRGQTCNVSCGPWLSLRGMTPHMRFTGVCQTPLFSGPCGLARSDWTFDAVLVAEPAASYPYRLQCGTITRQNGDSLPDGFGFENWFAFGMVVTPDGDVISIRQSSELSEGLLTLTLAREPRNPLANGAAVQIVPGCDGQAWTCRGHSLSDPKGKFNNYKNWMGARVAPGNLSLVRVNLPGNESGGKK